MEQILQRALKELQAIECCADTKLTEVKLANQTTKNNENESAKRFVTNMNEKLQLMNDLILQCNLLKQSLKTSNLN